MSPMQYKHGTGQRIAAVMADLATFIPVRHQPTGPVETFPLDRFPSIADL